MFHARDENAPRIPAVLTLSDGTTLNVSLRMPLTNRMVDALNNGDAFLDCVTPSGQQQFVAKSAIRAVRSARVPKADQLDAALPDPGTPTFDPYSILKVARDAPPEEIRQAYHRMARLYHPDRIASYELPDEVKDYVRAMLVRINLAFEQVGQ